MKTIYFLLFLGLTVAVQAQTLKYEKSRLYQEDKLLAPRQWESAFSGNTEALAYVKKAKSNYGTAQVIGFIGGFMIGWPIGTAIAGGEPEWALLGAGTGLVAISIPLTSAAKKNMNKAIQLQNGSSSSSRANVGVVFGGNQLGFKLQF